MRYVVEVIESEIDNSVTLKHYELYDTLVNEVLMSVTNNCEDLTRICEVLNFKDKIIKLLMEENLNLRRECD